jgi:hypothetical protein
MMDSLHTSKNVQSAKDAPTAQGQWHDLQTKGYVVVRSFLSQEEIALLLREFDSATEFPNATTYKVVSQAVIDAFKPKLLRTTASIATETDLRVDLPTGSVYFAISLGTELGWHQDHESFYEFREHYHYLNFYIPFKKPVPEKSNLSIIPLDALEKRSPKAFKQRKGNGACVALPFHGRTIMKDHDRGGFTVLPFDFNDIAISPDLGPGDLLLLRGDVFHKTQDTETDRIAISFRMVNSKVIVRRRGLVTFGLSLHKFLAHAGKRWRRDRYQTWSEVFVEAKKNELTADEYMSALHRVEKRGYVPQGSWGQFLKTLAKNWVSA